MSPPTLCEKGKGLIAASAGKIVRLFDQSGQMLKELAHPSTVTGLVFDGKGKRIGASHYNGASLWFVAAKVDTPRKLEWKGSHTGIIIHPEGEAVVTAMQENALHGWKLSGRRAHAHERLSRQDDQPVVYPQRQMDGQQWRRCDGAVAVFRWRPDGQGADWNSPGAMASSARRSPVTLRMRSSPAGLPMAWSWWRISLVPHLAGRAARSRADQRPGLEPGRHATCGRHRNRLCRADRFRQTVTGCGGAPLFDPPAGRARDGGRRVVVPGL